MKRALDRVWRIIPDSASGTLVARVVTMLLRLLTVPIIARVLGPDGRGITAAIITAFALVPLLISIGSAAEVRRIVANRGVDTVVHAANRFVVLSLVPALVAIPVVDQLLLAEESTSVRIASAVGLLIGIPTMISWMCDEAVLVARRKFRAVSWMQLAPTLANSIAILVSGVLGHLTVEVVLYSAIAATACTALIGRLLNRDRGRSSWRDLRAFIIGSAAFAGGVAADAMFNRLDQVVSLPLMGAQQLGLYSVAVTISVVPAVLGQAFGSVLLGDVGAAEKSERPAIHARIVRQALACALVIAGLMAIIVPFAIPLVFGNDFRGALVPVWICLGIAVVYIVELTTAMADVARGRGKRLSFAQALGLAVDIALLFVLAPLIGAVGAASASLAGHILATTLLLRDNGFGPAAIIPRPRDVRDGIALLRRRQSEAPPSNEQTY